MANDLQLWIWLQLALGCGSRNVRQICEVFGDVENFYRAGRRAWYDCRLFTKQEFDRLCAVSLTDTIDIIDACNRLGYRMVTPRDDEYPERLLNIHDYPAVLYICGQPIYFDQEVAITTVGMRKCTENGKQLARSIGYNLTKSGALVVSGGARGIDAACHEGALHAKGRTVAFLACGINTRYLIQNEQLRYTISRNGSLISEYPPGTPVYDRNFPVRNRLMSGVSLGTVVIESEYKSGSLITARHAVEQGRDVFAVPGNVMSRTSKGPNKLIANGAKPVMTAADILEEYVDLFPHKINLRYTDNSYPAPPPAKKYVSERQREWKNRYDPVNAPPTRYVPAPDAYGSFAYSYPNNPAPASLNNPGSSYDVSVTTVSRHTHTELNNPASVPNSISAAPKIVVNDVPVISAEENDNIAAGEELERLYVSSLNTSTENISRTPEGITHRIELNKNFINKSIIADTNKASQQAKKSTPPKKKAAVKATALSASKDVPSDNAANNYSETYSEIFKVLGSETLHIDEISSRTGRSTSELALTLTEMEIEGLIKSKPGRRFCRG